MATEPLRCEAEEILMLFLFISLTSERPMWRWLPYWTGQVQTLLPPDHPSPPTHSCTLTNRKQATPCTLLLRLLLSLASRLVRLFSVLSGLHPEAFSSVCSLWIILYSAKPVFVLKLGKTLSFLKNSRNTGLFLRGEVGGISQCRLISGAFQISETGRTEHLSRQCMQMAFTDSP